MGVYKFSRLGGNTLGQERSTITFDSHPRTSICKYFGLHEETFELRNKQVKGTVEHYDVYGGLESTEGNYKVGDLEYTDPRYLPAFQS